MIEDIEIYVHIYEPTKITPQEVWILTVTLLINDLIPS